MLLIRPTGMFPNLRIVSIKTQSSDPSSTRSNAHPERPALQLQFGRDVLVNPITHILQQLQYHDLL